jgi:hypothetical protein
MDTVVILSPIKPRTPVAIAQKFLTWLAQCVASAERHGIETVVILDYTGAGDVGKVSHAHRSTRIAGIRNRMLEEMFLCRHNASKEWLLWMDADIVGSGNTEVIPNLLSLCKAHSAVVAPAVFLEPPNGVIGRNTGAGDRVFYDTCGFIHEGKKSQARYPWMNAPVVAPGLYEVDGSVGCCFMSSGDLYVGGARFNAPENPEWTEHYPLCQRARLDGYKLLCSVNDPVYHAFLPSYGEAFH